MARNGAARHGSMYGVERAEEGMPFQGFDPSVGTKVTSQEVAKYLERKDGFREEEDKPMPINKIL